MSARVRWTPAEDAALKSIRAKNIPQQKRKALYAEQLPTRTKNAINNRARELDLPRRSGRNQRRWTDAERKILIEQAPHLDVGEIARLIGRSVSSVDNEMRRLNIPRREYQQVVATPEIDQAIREAYGSAQRGICQRVADRFGLKAGWVKARARKLGLTRSTGSAWTPAEDRIIEEMIEVGGARFIANTLKKAGFLRSISAVENRVHVLGMGWMTARDIYTANDLALAMGVCGKTVVGWIQRGLLKGRQENKSGLSYGADPKCWMIRHSDARKFLIENPNVYRLNTVDRHWFISTLAESHAAKVQDRCGVRTVASSGLEELSCHC